MRIRYDLTAPPTQLGETRGSLHRLAAYVIAPARHRATHLFGLRATRGGFGTPAFGAGRRIRVEGKALIDERNGAETRAEIDSLASAAAFLGEDIDPTTAAEHDSPALGLTDEPLAVDHAASTFLAAWFAMAFDALDKVRANPHSIDATQPQLWPGHFDPAIEMGDDAHRASYGASPGDASIEEPYLYVSTWWPDRLDLNREDPLWNAHAFTGAVLPLSSFGPGDPVAQAEQFWNETRAHLDALEVVE